MALRLKAAPKHCAFRRQAVRNVCKSEPDNREVLEQLALILVEGINRISVLADGSVDLQFLAEGNVTCAVKANPEQGRVLCGLIMSIRSHRQG
jgi:hypothetical protein